jgi:hypothetical protein
MNGHAAEAEAAAEDTNGHAAVAVAAAASLRTSRQPAGAAVRAAD